MRAICSSRAGRSARTWAGRHPGVLASALAVLALTVPVALTGQQSAGAAGGSPRIELVRELAIGGDPSRPEYQFTAIGAAAATRSGTVFVADAGQIRRYDRLGRYRGDVGKTGSGPGEYRSAQGMAVVGESLLVVHDWANGRMVLFDTTGTYRRMFRVAAYGGGGPLKTLAFFSDGSLAVRASMGEHPASGAGVPATAFVRYRVSGAVLDTIRAPAEATVDAALGVRNLGWRFAFPSATVFALLPRGGIATARSTAYRIEVAPASGPGFVVERSVAPIPLMGRERAEWQALLDFTAGQAPGGRPPTLPRHKPFIRDLSADNEGRLWVEVYTQALRRDAPPKAAGDPRPTLTMYEPNAYDVFDERGRFLGRLDLRPFSRLLAVQGNRVWVSEETEEGEILLVRYGLRMPLVR